MCDFSSRWHVCGIVDAANLINLLYPRTVCRPISVILPNDSLSCEGFSTLKKHVHPKIQVTKATLCDTL